jgi:hypothetical protein
MLLTLLGLQHLLIYQLLQQQLQQQPQQQPQHPIKRFNFIDIPLVVVEERKQLVEVLGLGLRLVLVLLELADRSVLVLVLADIQG